MTRLPVDRCQLTAIGYRLSAVGCRLSAIGYRLARWAPLGGASINAAFGGENHTTALRALEVHSPFGGWRHHLSPASGGTIKLRYAVSDL